MTTFYRREWTESRGDDHDDWGPSTWYFEVDEDGSPLRQVEVYKNGNVLKYSRDNIEDEFGALGDQVLDRLDFSPFEVAADVFEAAWKLQRKIAR